MLCCQEPAVLYSMMNFYLNQFYFNKITYGKIGRLGIDLHAASMLCFQEPAVLYSVMSIDLNLFYSISHEKGWGRAKMACWSPLHEEFP